MRLEEEPLFYRFQVILYEALSALLFLLFLLLSETSLTQPSVHTTFRIFSFVQAGILVVMMVWVCTSEVIRLQPVVAYIIANILRSYIFCLSVFFLLPPYDWIWFFSPVYLMLVKIFSWYCYEWQQNGFFELRHSKMLDDTLIGIPISSTDSDNALLGEGRESQNQMSWMKHHLSGSIDLPYPAFDVPNDSRFGVGRNLALKIDD